MRYPISFAIAAVLGAAPLSVRAEVAASSESGFVSHNVTEVPAAPSDTWAALFTPAAWWNGEHTYSGDAANLTIEPVAGGCFCETIPGADRTPAGQIEHMRVLYIDPRTRTFRMTGALGPLQSEAVTAVLTMTVEPSGSGSRITWDYVVGGYMRMPMAQMAPLVDQVIGEQLSRLAARLGKS
jgi:hypothetical protein